VQPRRAGAADRRLSVDNRLVRQSVLPWGVRIALNSSVTSDAQVVRYLALAIQGSTHPVVLRVKATLATLSRSGWSWDFFTCVFNGVAIPRPQRRS
jgi:hypothetical protein